MNVNNPINTAKSDQFCLGQVTYADGTTIGYRQIGSGPGLVIMHGGLRASRHYQRLASALADVCTVYTLTGAGANSADRLAMITVSSKSAKIWLQFCKRQVLA